MPAAEACYRKALAIYRQAHGADSQAAAIALGNLARIAHDRKDYAQTVALAEESLAIWRDAKGAEDPEVHATLLYWLGLGHAHLSHFEDAEEALLEAHERAESGLGAEHYLTRLVMSALVELYRASGRPEDAEEWRGRLGK
jgi:tetratricopeptide (TPR) repeat protein